MRMMTCAVKMKTATTPVPHRRSSLQNLYSRKCLRHRSYYPSLWKSAYSNLVVHQSVCLTFTLENQMDYLFGHMCHFRWWHLSFKGRYSSSNNLTINSKPCLLAAGGVLSGSACENQRNRRNPLVKLSWPLSYLKWQCLKANPLQSLKEWIHSAVTNSGVLLKAVCC